MEYWSGKFITSLKENEVFVFGSNPSGIHGAGAAKAARAYGAVLGQGRGLMGNSYAIVTKNLEGKEGYLEKSTGMVYDKAGYRSVSPAQIRQNVDEMYELARGEHKDKKFLISYQYESWPNGTPKKSLNGYDSQEMLEMFVRDDIPPNIVFHDSYKPHLDKVFNKKEQFTFFFETKDVHSQWTPSLFKYKEYEFISTEQFMMFSKAKTFKDEDVAQKIMGIGEIAGDSEEDKAIHDLIKGFREGNITRDDVLTHHTKTWKEIQSRIKQLGREVSNYDDSVWSAKRVPVVRVANREKYAQNPEMMQELLATQGTTLVEASPYDKIWGIGLASSHPDALTRDKWKGLNLLGETLTELREHFMENTRKSKLKM